MLSAKRFALGMFLTGMGVCSSVKALSPEDVLGNYWEDPLFGKAASDRSVHLEILHKRIWPQSLEVRSENTVRFVIENKSDELHIIAFTDDVETLIADERFIAFTRDEIFHANKKHGPSNSHSHTGANADGGVDIVKTIDQRPTVTVAAHDRKEILIRFDEEEDIIAFCAIDAHHEEGYQTFIRVNPSKQESGNESNQKL